MEPFVGLYVKKISEKLEKRANGENADSGSDITFTQGKILWFLQRRESEGRATTMRDIEKYFDCSHATVSGLISRLTEKGRVSLEIDPKDRRAKKVCLTGRGAEFVRETNEQHARMEETLLDGFSGEEKASFLEYLDRVYNNLG
jgi:DNA-binding MarR family transcriptional regulator